MDRSEKTKLLSELLKSQYLAGEIWADEVVIDACTKDVKRIDFLKFVPENISVGGIEKGKFIVYEVKSCKADFNSGFGKNFIAENNYFVMDMITYKQVMQDIPDNIGVLVPVPGGMDNFTFFENPRELEKDEVYELRVISPSYKKNRDKSMIELLYAMLRRK